MEPCPVDLASFSVRDFDRGAGIIKEALWIFISAFLFRLWPFSFSAIKCTVLRLFGAQIGKCVIIKPNVKITFPWKLTVGDHVWIGEQSWLLNLAPIHINSNVCISQRAFLCTGNHNYKSASFDLITGPIVVESGAWLGAQSFVGPGVKVGSHSILTAGSVTTTDLTPYGIYKGNPAVLTKRRELHRVKAGKNA